MMGTLHLVFNKLVRRSGIPVAIGLLMLGFAGSANAIFITGNTSFTKSWIVPASGTTPLVDITATSTWTVTNFSATGFDLTIDVTNTTVLPGIDPGNENTALMAIAFGTDPTATAGFNSTGTVFTNLIDSGATLGGFVIDVCAFGGNNCQGGNVNDGLQAGTSDSFSLNISGSFASGVELAPQVATFQGTWGSYQVDGSVPEPFTLGLIGIGLLGLYGTRKALNV